MSSLARALGVVTAAALPLSGVCLVPAAQAATDSFYTYTGSAPLSSYAPGAVLKTRTINYHVVGIPVAVKATQLLYRTTDARGQAVANVTSVLKAPRAKPNQAVAYQSFYDSLDPEHSPSRSIAGNVSLGGLINNVEGLFIAPSLLAGRSVIVADTEGQSADFAAGPTYGAATLDSIRASKQATETGLGAGTKVGLLGYSGGAIATNWAAAMAPSYAPDVNKDLVGYTEGGLLVDPAHNLRYVTKSVQWGGIMPMAIIGIGRAYGIDFTPYLSSYGKTILAKMNKASIINVLFQYPTMTWAKLVKPEYANPNSIPAYVDAVNKLNLGSRPSPTIPGQVAQGMAGWLNGTDNTKPGIGPGDGVMIAGDVRTLLRQYCASGAAVSYTQHPLLEHASTALAWAPGAMTWLNDRFAGKKAPNNCASIRPGNPLTPESLA